MNRDAPDDDGAFRFYDGDYPSLEIGVAGADEVRRLAAIGLLGDVPFYRTLAVESGGPVLEIGCGTGRLAIPMARAGVAVWAVDSAPAMLAQLAAKLAREPAAVRDRIAVVHGDAVALDLPDRGRFALAILPFNVAMLVADAGQRRRLLAAVVSHLAPGGRLALDVMNPLALDTTADTKGVPSEPRFNPLTATTYIKMSLADAVDGDGVQRVYGWYGELRPDGGVTLTEYGFRWRMIGRDEVEAMLAEAGLTVERVSGDFEGTPWTPDSRRIVVTAKVMAQGETFQPLARR